MCLLKFGSKHQNTLSWNKSFKPVSVDISSNIVQLFVHLFIYFGGHGYIKCQINKKKKCKTTLLSICLIPHYKLTPLLLWRQINLFFEVCQRSHEKNWCIEEFMLFLFLNMRWHRNLERGGFSVWSWRCNFFSGISSAAPPARLRTYYKWKCIFRPDYLSWRSSMLK